MQKKDGVFVLEHVESNEVRAIFQGFQGIIVTGAGPNVVEVLEGYYKDGEYFVFSSLGLTPLSLSPDKRNLKEIKKMVDSIITTDYKERFEFQIPEVAVTENMLEMLEIA